MLEQRESSGIKRRRKKRVLSTPLQTSAVPHDAPAWAIKPSCTNTVVSPFCIAFTL